MTLLLSEQATDINSERWIIVDLAQRELINPLYETTKILTLLLYFLLLENQIKKRFHYTLNTYNVNQMLTKINNIN